MTLRPREAPRSGHAKKSLARSQEQLFAMPVGLRQPEASGRLAKRVGEGREGLRELLEGLAAHR
eukprot:4064829-Heterocapsa_arctica.AAC.1